MLLLPVDKSTYERMPVLTIGLIVRIYLILIETAPEAYENPTATE
jgi:hypothetical protein